MLASAGNTEVAKTIAIELDQTPPTVSCVATPAILKPVNRKLVPVNVSVNVTDSLSGPAGFELLSVTSSDPNTTNDIQGFVPGTPSVSGLLRAARRSEDRGRVYTLTYQGSDNAGNSATCTTQVRVPRRVGEQQQVKRPRKRLGCSVNTLQVGLGKLDYAKYREKKH